MVDNDYSSHLFPPPLHLHLPLPLHLHLPLPLSPCPQSGSWGTIDLRRVDSDLLFTYPCPYGYCRCMFQTKQGRTTCITQLDSRMPNNQCACNRRGQPLVVHTHRTRLAHRAPCVVVLSAGVYRCCSFYLILHQK